MLHEKNLQAVLLNLVFQPVNVLVLVDDRTREFRVPPHKRLDRTVDRALRLAAHGHEFIEDLRELRFIFVPDTHIIQPPVFLVNFNRICP